MESVCLEQLNGDMVEEASQEKPLRITKEMLKQGNIPSLLDNLHCVGALYKEVW